MRLVLMALILLSALPVAPARRLDRLTIWNVGQGLWVTVMKGDLCRHFDAGGERWPLKKVRRACHERGNRLFLSHWDLDHVGGVRALRGLLPNLCLEGSPLGPAPSLKKQNLLKGIRDCGGAKNRAVREVQWRRYGKTSNDASRVWVAEEKYLLPGDSSSTEENRWAAQLPPLLRGLVVGHHGSRTSTSNFLLKHLPNLKWAVISARKKRYGHPHRETVFRLRQFRVPMLRTDEWGDLIFQL